MNLNRRTLRLDAIGLLSAMLLLACEPKHYFGPDLRHVGGPPVFVGSGDQVFRMATIVGRGTDADPERILVLRIEQVGDEASATFRLGDSVHGGFVRYRWTKPVHVQLTEEEAAEFQRRVETAEFWDAPPRVEEPFGLHGDICALEGYANGSSHFMQRGGGSGTGELFHVCNLLVALAGVDDTLWP